MCLEFTFKSVKLKIPIFVPIDFFKLGKLKIKFIFKISKRDDSAQDRTADLLRVRQTQ